MFVHQISFYRWSVEGSAEGTVQVKGDNAALSIKFNEQELAQLEAIATAAYERNHRQMIEDLSRPLETGLLAAPAPAPIVNAEFDEVIF